MARSGRFWVNVACVLGLGAAQGCANTNGCPEGFVRRGADCVATCNTGSQCASTEVCLDGVCVAGGADAAATETSSSNSSSSAPDSSAELSSSQQVATSVPEVSSSEFASSATVSSSASASSAALPSSLLRPPSSNATSAPRSSSRVCTVALCDDGNPCTTDSCSATGTCVHTARANGTGCSGGSCCSGACVSLTTTSNCGVCGLHCPAGRSCVANPDQPGAVNCTCLGNSECPAAYGANASCYPSGGVSLCNCQCPNGAATCTGLCAGTGTCHDVTGQNYCTP